MSHVAHAINVIVVSCKSVLGQFCDFFFKQLAQLGDNWYNFLLVSWNHGIGGIKQLLQPGNNSYNWSSHKVAPGGVAKPLINA